MTISSWNCSKEINLARSWRCQVENYQQLHQARQIASSTVPRSQHSVLLAGSGGFAGADFLVAVLAGVPVPFLAAGVGMRGGTVWIPSYVVSLGATGPCRDSRYPGLANTNIEIAKLRDIMECCIETMGWKYYPAGSLGELEFRY